MASVADPLPSEQPRPASVPAPLPWAAMGWVAAALLLCYLPILIPLVRQWSDDEDMGHGFFVPLVAAYIAWLKKDQLLNTPIRRNYWGLAILGWAAIQALLGTLGAELFLQRTAFVFSIIGSVLFLCGWEMLKALSLPLFLLFFMVPIPQIIYTQITFPLQLFASRVAETLLTLFGIPVLRDGNVLELANQKLSVVEACSGIRSLLSLSFLSLVYGFLFDKKAWMRWALLILTVPIAIVANAGRVTITGILSDVRPDLAQGFFHSVEGWVIFVVALAMLVIAHRLINFVHGQWVRARELGPVDVS